MQFVFEQGEYRLQLQGAMGFTALGVGFFLGALLKRWRGVDITLEALSSAAHVAWATAIGATAIPISVPGRYNDEALTALCAGAYGVIPSSPHRFGDMEQVVSGILCLNDDSDVVELSEAVPHAK
jgi:hypothetical protein